MLGREGIQEPSMPVVIKHLKGPEQYGLITGFVTSGLQSSIEGYA